MIGDILLSIIAAIGWSGCFVLLLLLRSQGPGAAPLLRRHVYFKIVAWSVVIATQTLYYIQSFFDATTTAAYNLWLPVAAYEPVSSILFRGFLAIAMWDLVRNLMRPRFLDSTPTREAQIQIDPFGLVTDWNAEATALFGWTAQEVMGKELAVFCVPPGYQDAHRQGLAHYRETDEAPILDTRITVPAMTKDGRRLIVDLRIKAVLTSAGTRFLAIVTPALALK